jgi:hypothetical protein
MTRKVLVGTIALVAAYVCAALTARSQEAQPTVQTFPINVNYAALPGLAGRTRRRIGRRNSGDRIARKD